MVIGESGQPPPSVFSHINVLPYMGRLQTLPAHTVVNYPDSIAAACTPGLQKCWSYRNDMASILTRSIQEILSYNVSVLWKLIWKPMGIWHPEYTPKPNTQILLAL